MVENIVQLRRRLGGGRVRPDPDPSQPDPFLERLRELRVEIQDLQTVLENIRKGETTPKAYASYIQKTKRDIDELLQGIEDGDSIRHLFNLWEQMSVSPLLTDPEVDLEPQQQLHHLNMLDKQCQGLVLQIGYLTIPQRVECWLANARSGYYVPFHAVFEDELPALEDRIKVLNFIAWQPLAIRQGLVDVTNGLVYRYSKHPWRSMLLLVLGLTVTAGIVVGACFLPIEEWLLSPEHLSTLLIGWGAVLTGVVVHAGVETVKRAQAHGRPPIIAVGELPLHIDARIGQIFLKLLLSLVGLFGVAFTGGVDNVTPLNTFLVGYSLDSFVGLFSASLEQKAAAQLTALKQQLGVAGE